MQVVAPARAGAAEAAELLAGLDLVAGVRRSPARSCACRCRSDRASGRTDGRNCPGRRPCRRRRRRRRSTATSGVPGVREHVVAGVDVARAGGAERVLGGAVVDLAGDGHERVRVRRSWRASGRASSLLLAGALGPPWPRGRSGSSRAGLAEIRLGARRRSRAARRPSRAAVMATNAGCRTRVRHDGLRSPLWVVRAKRAGAGWRRGCPRGPARASVRGHYGQVHGGASAVHGCVTGVTHRFACNRACGAPSARRITLSACAASGTRSASTAAR